jgi:hypothetical protein
MRQQLRTRLGYQPKSTFGCLEALLTELALPNANRFIESILDECFYGHYICCLPFRSFLNEHFNLNIILNGS